MNLVKTVFVFALGFMCASILERPMPVQAQGSQIDQATLNALKQRLSKLEKLGCAALGKTRVVAPFRVVDRRDPTNTIFEVNNNSAVLYNGTAAVAEITASDSGGLLVARGHDNTVCVGICSKVTGVAVIGYTPAKTPNEDRTPIARILLGKMKEKSDYALKIFTSSGSAELAGIGESPDTHAGLAFINDASGNRKAVIAVGKDGTGSVEVVSAGRTIVQLTESEHHGGRLVICSVSQCNPPMVSAGDAGGFGLVAAGPLYFNTGGEFLSGKASPGSFIKGKE